jgi:hypothetical protein
VLVPIKMPVFKQREVLKNGMSVNGIHVGPLCATIRVSRKAARTIEYISEISLDAFYSEVRISNISETVVICIPNENIP